MRILNKWIKLWIQWRFQNCQKTEERLLAYRRHCFQTKSPSKQHNQAIKRAVKKCCNLWMNSITNTDSWPTILKHEGVNLDHKFPICSAHWKWLFSYENKEEQETQFFLSDQVLIKILVHQQETLWLCLGASVMLKYPFMKLKSCSSKMLTLPWQT